MNKNIRLLVESFFDDEIFNVENNIKSDIEDLGRYYDYNVGEIIYQNKKPYAICCGESKYFNDNKSRFCLLIISLEKFEWRMRNTEVKELKYFEFKDFYLKSFNDFLYIDEDGYRNTLIIKNNYNISEFPAFEYFEYCLNLGDNIYLPAIDELLMMYLNRDKLGKYSFRADYYWSSTLYSSDCACYISTEFGNVGSLDKFFSFHILPFFHLD